MKPIPDPGLAEEFRRHPCGQHSEALKRLLERFRSAPMPGKHVLVELAHCGPWQAARLGATRGAPVEPIAGAVFERIEDAEWFVFKARWLQHFGQALGD